MEKNRIEVALPMLGCEEEYSLYDTWIKEDLKNRIMVINSAINSDIIEEQVMAIIRWNAEDKDIPVEKRKPITLYINSLGGSALDGQALIDVVLASKTKVRTVCVGVAASMAYLIYIAGHERIAFTNSCFLQHEGETSVGGVTSKARDTMEFFDTLEERNKKFVLAQTTISEEKYQEVYKKEWWMYSQEAKSYGIVNKIIGEDCDIDILF